MGRKAIVVGASSGIGASMVKRLVQDGYEVVAVARRLQALEEVCGEAATPLVHDVTALDTVQTAFDQAVEILGGVDLVLYSAGVMPEIGPEEFDTAKDTSIISVNVLGAMAWFNAAARVMSQQGSGTLVGIGSVAGERGRIGNPAYCASKAALHTYLESLRNRLDRRGVQVITIKPGPVETPMTAGRDKLPFLIGSDEAAQQIMKAVRSRQQVRFVPFVWAPIMAVVRSIPSVMFRRMNF